MHIFTEIDLLILTIDIFTGIYYNGLNYRGNAPGKENITMSNEVRSMIEALSEEECRFLYALIDFVKGNPGKTPEEIASMLTGELCVE